MPDTPEEEMRKSAFSIVGVVAGSLVIVGVGVGGFIHFARKRAKITQLVEIQVSEEKWPISTT